MTMGQFLNGIVYFVDTRPLQKVQLNLKKKINVPLNSIAQG